MKSLVKKLRKKKTDFVKMDLPRYFQNSGFLSSLYFSLFDPSFKREHQAVLAGKVKHIDEAKRIKANYFLLVRNTHRIEKGLLMRPRRAVFGKDYVKETVDSFEGVFKEHTDYNSTPQLKWFYDVLNEYFTNAGDENEIIAREGKRFYTITKGHDFAKEEIHFNKSIPYKRLEEEKSTISYQDFYKLCRQRRSVRWFKDEPVPRELIDKAILAANQAPSACNRQPYEFRVFDDKQLLEEVVKLPMGTKGYGHSIQVMIVIVGNLDAYFDERDRHVIYIDASLASMSLMFALETLGLSSCAINWPDIEEREQKMARFLKLGKHQRPLMCLGVGYPDPEGLIAFSEKRSLDQIRKYNK